MLKIRMITTGNEELDVKMAGGLPFPALVVVEGGHGTGKSVLVQQFAYGALKSDLKVTVVTTETTTIGYVRGMINVGFNVLDEYLRGRLVVYSTQIPRVKWVTTTSRDLLFLTLKHMVSNLDKYDVFIIDSFSILVKGSRREDIANFLTVAKRIVDKGKLIILTTHPEGLSESLHSGLKAIADGYIELKNVEMGGRALKVMNIIKLKGVPTVFENTITFDVDPAFGIKLVPMALAKV
ncbi:ATPase domain-containing protein [Thermosphaera aggregans]|jgi:flagellar protein FlaH|uniref:ATPase involved in biogenesis of flagella n=1 Tax=Thermosphaera aggregans (strain DSM 11486 / M11TL) TaxID=633148 RepID=D5U2X0_THEAM|nr:ATPase domain-containing protein [Thermosphaera aggregans]ADG91470.1 ATPase involved in biogenesis of flagella [Thermosphaera aggregans DSM 11486]